MELLKAEEAAGSRIWIGSPQCSRTPKGSSVLMHFLAEFDVPYYGIDNDTNCDVTHYLIAGKLLTPLDK